MLLEPHDKRVLRLIQSGVWLRVAGGYACPGQPMIKIRTAERLCGKGLAVAELQHSRYRLRLTPAGSLSLKPKETA